MPSPECRWLGDCVGVPVKVRCEAIHGQTEFRPAYRCECEGAPKNRCVPEYDGEWALPEQATEAAAYMICRRCPHFAC